MDAYYCKFCKYHTKNEKHFDEHIKTNKHAKNTTGTIFFDKINPKDYKKKIYVCDSCDIVYLSNRALLNHKKSCKSLETTSKTIDDSNKITELETRLKELEIKLKFKDEILEIKESLIKLQEKELDTKNTLVSNAMNTINKSIDVTEKSMSILKYANMYLSNGKPIEKLEGNDIFDVIKYDNFKKNEITNETYVKTVLHKFINGIFHSFIGDMIIEYYKPTTKNETNFIATDTSRLCFIIMQTVKCTEKSNKTEWINDKSATKFTELVLKPLMSAISDILSEYLKFKNKSTNSEYSMELTGKCLALKRDISVGKFIKPILRHVAPSFHFDKIKFLDDNNEKPKKIIKIKK